VLHAGELREALFQLGDLRTENPGAAFDGGGNRLVQWLAETKPLGLQIDKGNGLGHGYTRDFGTRSF
jgi:hypothetical protein